MRSLRSYFYQTAGAVGLIDLDAAFVRAAGKGETNNVKALLEAGTDVHLWGDSPLVWASADGHAETVKALLDAGANVHARDELALQVAASGGHTDIVKILLAAGADIHANDLALFRAVYNNRIDAARTLLEAGANAHNRAMETLIKMDDTETIEMVRKWIARTPVSAPRGAPTPGPPRP